MGIMSVRKDTLVKRGFSIINKGDFLLLGEDVITNKRELS